MPTDLPKPKDRPDRFTFIVMFFDALLASIIAIVGVILPKTGDALMSWYSR